MAFVMPAIQITHSGEEVDTSPVNNRMVRQYLTNISSLRYEDLPGWIDDVISGATSQVGGSARIGRGRLFSMLLALDEITTATVAQLMNRKRIALGDKPYGARHCRKVAAALRCASNGIKHHQAYHREKPDIEAVPAFHGIKPLPYTSEEIRELKRLSLNSPFSASQAYEAELKAKYNNKEVTP